MISNTELPAFAEGLTNCPKCGWQHSINGMPATYCSGFSLWPVNLCQIKGEHVHRICNNCGVSLPQQCKDKTAYDK